MPMEEEIAEEKEKTAKEAGRRKRGRANDFPFSPEPKQKLGLKQNFQ